MDQVTLDKWNKNQDPHIFRVSEVSAIISHLLENEDLQNIWISGEITNFKRHSSGHLYFSLFEKKSGKESVISCSIWKSKAQYLDFLPEDGMEVRAYGSVSHYEPGGRYSFQITQMRPSGAGEKALLIEQWRREMAGKGWFNSERKRTLPKFPEKIGVVTSPTGAVIHDIENVISGRFPAEIILSPTIVQGPLAHEDIARAIGRVQGMVDVLIVGRGGGSNEDLFSFNHPVVVEAIVNSPVPVISAIGHDVDITLADLAADISASTPSHAAELCVPDRKSEYENLVHLKKRMFLRLIQNLERSQEDLNAVRDRLSFFRLQREMGIRRENLVEISDRLLRAGEASRQRAHSLLLELKGRIDGRNPRNILIRELPDRRAFMIELTERLTKSVSARIAREKTELRSMSAILAAHGPKEAFKRGYCLVHSDGKVVRSVCDIHPGAMVQLRFLNGTADAEIRKVQYDEKI
ncbi:exodeoxyribonuclease VII large subunit [Methanospirillum stamsii]|uniref:Exodeoxyribonuclease VII large subunit n=1 Tax=Methanospirillum stamsii TaxID=1277351 RepID=A0A2V2NBZ9_9EURY|nr:exodeoxyribonuclease VII large subunit [Methanospirillum stamsii]PWR76105.1 exodeoxyribonuclease VII large subunit [Methanospirillum stamsii]